MLSLLRFIKFIGHALQLLFILNQRVLVTFVYPHTLLVSTSQFHNLPMQLLLFCLHTLKHFNGLQVNLATLLQHLNLFHHLFHVTLYPSQRLAAHTKFTIYRLHNLHHLTLLMLQVFHALLRLRKFVRPNQFTALHHPGFLFIKIGFHLPNSPLDRLGMGHGLRRLLRQHPHVLLPLCHLSFLVLHLQRSCLSLSLLSKRGFGLPDSS